MLGGQMSDRDLLSGFRQCKSEIQSLRRANELMGAKLEMADKILNAVNSHSPERKPSGASEDILWNISQTEQFLEGKIAKSEQASKMVGQAKEVPVECK